MGVSIEMIHINSKVISTPEWEEHKLSYKQYCPILINNYNMKCL